MFASRRWFGGSIGICGTHEILGLGCRRELRGGKFFPFDLAGLSFKVPHFLFKGGPKVRGSFSELGHELAQAAGKLGKLLRPKNDQDHDEDHNHVRNAQHCVCGPSNKPIGIIERVPKTVKPDFRPVRVILSFYEAL